MNCPDLPLFAVPRMFRTSDPQTSQDAAAKVARKLSALHRQVIAVLAAAGARGLTGREIETLPQFVAYAPSSCRKRLSELHQMGRVTDAGRRDGLTVYVLAQPEEVAA